MRFETGMEKWLGSVESEGKSALLSFCLDGEVEAKLKQKHHYLLINKGQLFKGKKSTPIRCPNFGTFRVGTIKVFR